MTNLVTADTARSAVLKTLLSETTARLEALALWLLEEPEGR